jgi:hypothetical protein
MVTVLVEKREFGEKLEAAGRAGRSGKPAANISASPPAANPPANSRPGDAFSHEDFSPGHRYRQIRVFAYYKADQRGFAPGHMWDDWLAAVREVDARNGSR